MDDKIKTIKIGELSPSTASPIPVSNIEILHKCVNGAADFGGTFARRIS
jgi:hypothetical protein